MSPPELPADLEALIRAAPDDIAGYLDQLAAELRRRRGLESTARMTTAHIDK
jgi:hypothetical protein